MRKIATALLIDDDDAFRRTLMGALRRRAVKALTAATVEEALALAEDAPLDLIVVDYRMPRVDGLSALSRLRQLNPQAVIVMLTGFGDIPLTVAAMRQGADTLMTKPVEVDRLLREANAIREATMREPPTDAEGGAVGGRGAGLDSTLNLEEVERQAIDRALQRTGGVVAAAARILGIDRRTLQRKLKKLS